MVMHARKLPRLNDGYYDRHDYHEDKNDRFQSRNNSYDRIAHDRRIRDEHGGVGDRQNSPRYGHKPPYTDRMRSDKDRHKYNREKERLPRSEDHRLNPLDKPNINSGSISSRNAISDYKFVDTNSDNGTDSNQSNDKGCTRALDELKTSSCSEKSNSNQTKDHRVEAQKVALRVCGDWSEHVSSSGKKYFYNCKTEVSQWVKPSEWKVADEQVKQANVRVTSSSAATSFTTNPSMEASNYNGSSHDTSDDTSLDSPNRHRSTKFNNTLQDSLNNSKSETSKIDRIAGNSSTDSITAASNRNSSNLLQSDKQKYSRDSNGANSQFLNDRHSISSATSCTSSPSSRHVASPKVHDSSNKLTGKVNKQLTNGSNEGSGDDMDISPEGSPKPLLESSRTHQPSSDKIALKSEEGGSSAQPPGAPQSNNTEQNMIWGKALQTLQTLQEVLERSRGSSSQTVTFGRSGESPISAASQSPRVIPLTVPISSSVEKGSEDATSSDKSPATSEDSAGQHSILSAAMAAAAAAAADSNSSCTVLSPSFKNYYDSSMISHISDWPAEQIELRAHMAYKDGIIICGHHCGQVSTELKRDRSYVRIAEVQSTLIEHRIMFLKQQISELETQDRNFTSGQT